MREKVGSAAAPTARLRIRRRGCCVTNRRSLLLSLSLDVRRLDDGPPLLDFGRLQCAERLGRLLLAGRDLLPQVSEPRAYRWIGQGIYRGGIELCDDGRRCTLAREQCIPDRKIQSGQASFVNRRDIG